VIRLLRQPAGPLVSPPASEKFASVEGMVINQLTGAPLPRVHVSLSNFDDGVHRDYGAMTNPDGTFSITGMPPITYGVVITRAGFANPRACCTSVTLRAGEHMRGLKLPLVPSGAIAGRVLGPDGEPAEDINVFVSGKRGLQGSHTDEQGRFRIAGLLPGSYRLEASPQTWNEPSKHRRGTNHLSRLSSPSMAHRRPARGLPVTRAPLKCRRAAIPAASKFVWRERRWYELAAESLAFRKAPAYRFRSIVATGDLATSPKPTVPLRGGVSILASTLYELGKGSVSWIW
jgi:hypothetical protein